MKMFWHICVMMIASLQLMVVRFAFVFSIPINACVFLSFASVDFAVFAGFFSATQHITAGAVTAVFVVCYVWQLGTALKYFFPQNSRYNIFAMRLKTVTVFYLTPLSLSRVLCHFAFSMDSTVRRGKTTKITLLLNSDCVSFFPSLSRFSTHDAIFWPWFRSKSNSR